jgi:diaminopimelate epimerase
MDLPFTKMHGLSNDFVVIDSYTRPVTLNPGQVRFLADRHQGIGCDQLLLVERPESPDSDFRYRIFNQDGDEVEQCGNGARCFARFVMDKGLTDKSEISVETTAGIIRLHLAADGQVTVDMGVPRFEPGDLPFAADRPAERYCLDLGNRQVKIGVVSIGNPHAVIDVASLGVTDIAAAPVAELGPRVESHPRFPRRVNTGFMQVLARDTLHLRVFERGVGETQACGTGACAAMVVARRWGMVDDNVNVKLLGGPLSIHWTGAGTPVLMTGPAETVFEGHITLPPDNITM